VQGTRIGAVPCCADLTHAPQVLILVLSCCLIAKIPTKDAQEQALLDEARQANRGAPMGGSTSYQAGTKQQTSYA
jgi:hypothetical protein